MFHDVETPDVLTASDLYAKRFSGSAGRFLLDRQQALVAELLLDWPDGRGRRVLEVGGGHAQLTAFLLERGFDVVVHGSSPECRRRLDTLSGRWHGTLQFVPSSIWTLPFPDRSFDLVIAVRLFAHLERWKEALGEMSRVCARRMIIDFPPKTIAGKIDPIMVRLKRILEGKATRPYFRYHPAAMTREFREQQFPAISIRRQCAIPLVVHRTAGSGRFSRAAEALAEKVGITHALGSPALIMGERRAPGTQRSV